MGKARTFATKALTGAVLTSTILLGGCTTERFSRGYIWDNELMEAVIPGIDNRNSVAKSLGTPSLTSTFAQDGVYYYASFNARRRAFWGEETTNQTVMAISFDEYGVVNDVKKYTMADAQDITPRDDVTPTRGRSLGFFQQIFGNVGRFNSMPGQGGPGGL